MEEQGVMSMWLDLYHFLHETWNMCFWTLPALILAVLMVIIGCVHRRNTKKREEAYEKKLADMIQQTKPEMDN